MPKRSKKSSYKAAKRRKVVGYVSRRRSKKRTVVPKMRMYRPVRFKLSSHTVHYKSNVMDLWIGNTIINDIVGCYLEPKIGGQSGGTDTYAYMTNSATGTGWSANICGLVSNTRIDLIKQLYRYGKVTKMWFKYIPALTGGDYTTVQNVPVSGGITGVINYCVGRHSEFPANYPLTTEGLASFKSKVNSRAVNMYKPYYTSWRPSKYQQFSMISGGNTSRITKHCANNIVENTAIVVDQNRMYLAMEVPKVSGKEQPSTSPFEGTNFPDEGNVVIIGSVAMGCTVTYYGAINS
jgi:hypothetical protein